MSYSTRFYLEVRKGKKEHPIRLNFVFDGQRIMTTTGLKATVDQWSTKQQSFKPSASNAAALNEILKGIAGKIETIYLNILAKGETPTQERVLNEYRGHKQLETWQDYLDNFTSTEGRNNAWSLSTYQKFKTLKNHLENFEREKSFKITFAKVDRDFYQSLFDYFAGIGHRNTHIKKTFKILNWFLAWVMKTKKIPMPGLKDFEIKDKIKSSKGAPERVIFLHPEEFLMMYEAVIHDIRLNKVRDIFLFMCSTGLRWSDYYSLKPENVQDGIINITMQKIPDPIEIPLNFFSKSILEKYDFDLPKLSNQRLNDYLKELAALLNLDRKLTRVYVKAGEVIREEVPLHRAITCHVARRTFISLSIAMNINSEVLMRFTGHASHETMKIYLGITGQKKRAEMTKFTAKNIKKQVNQ